MKIYIFIVCILDQTRLSVWVLDGDPGHANLLRFALSSERFPHTLVMLVAAMTTPWAILDQLQAWAALLGDHIDKLPLNNDTRQQCRHLSMICDILIGHLLEAFSENLLKLFWQILKNGRIIWNLVMN